MNVILSVKRTEKRTHSFAQVIEKAGTAKIEKAGTAKIEKAGTAKYESNHTCPVKGRSVGGNCSGFKSLGWHPGKNDLNAFLYK